MSINPVRQVETLPTPNTHAGEPKLSSAASPSDIASTPAGSGKFPKPQEHAPAPVQKSSEIPRDEVRVQRDSANGGQIIIRYLDGFGNLVLQIPTSQVLGLARAIDQALEEQAKVMDLHSEEGNL